MLGEGLGEAVAVGEACLSEDRICRGCRLCTSLISHKTLFKSQCRSQLPHKSVNLSFIVDKFVWELTCAKRLQEGLGEAVAIGEACLEEDCVRRSGPLPSEHGAYETVKTRFWP